MEESKRQGISRRGFIAGAATLAATGLVGCAAAPSNVAAQTAGSATGSLDIPTRWDYETDVIVVGAGGGGYAAVGAAHEVGARTLMIDKAKVTGGDTVLCAGMTCGPWPKRAQKDLGQTDSVESYITDWKNSHQFSSKGRAGVAEVGDTSYITRMCELFEEAFDWTSDVAGINWQMFPNAAWYPMPTWETVAPRQWRATNGIIPPLRTLINTYDDCTILTGTEVYDLICNEEGRAIGVRMIDADGKRLVAKAKRGVILTTGTFMNDRSMVTDYLPFNANRLTPGGCNTVTGDGHKMVQRIGGGLKDMTLGNHWFSKSLGSEASTMVMSWSFIGDYFGKFIGSVPGIMINYDAKRYVAESLGYNITAKTTAVQRNSIGFYVVDSQATDGLLPDNLYDDTFVTSDTLEGLARCMGVDAKTFTAEVARYNSFVDTGKDADFDKVMEGCTRVEKAPFYALAIRPMPYATYGGIDVDVDGRVLTTGGKAIPGLYAAGICTGSFAEQAGVFYTGGVVQAVTFGRQAGRLAATENEEV